MGGEEGESGGERRGEGERLYERTGTGLALVRDCDLLEDPHNASTEAEAAETCVSVG